MRDESGEAMIPAEFALPTNRIDESLVAIISKMEALSRRKGKNSLHSSRRVLLRHINAVKNAADRSAKVARYTCALARNHDRARPSIANQDGSALEF